MNIPTKKLESGFEIPVYGLGLWQMGGTNSQDRSKDAEEIAAIRTAIEAGITHIDTAETYGNGHAEELLREAVQGYSRNKLFIGSKVAAFNQGYDGVLRAAEASLERLGMEYLDLYMLHRYPEPGLDITGTMRAMDELLDQGLVRNIGVSNLTPRRFNEAQRHSRHKLVCNQVHYNVQYRESENRGVLRHAQENDVMLVAWRPVQKGSIPRSAVLDELAAKYDKTATQVAINWLVSQKNVVTIAKTSNKDHLYENLGAVNWTMDFEDIERIRAEFPDQKMTSDAVALDYAADVSA